MNEHNRSPTSLQTHDNNVSSSHISTLQSQAIYPILEGSIEQIAEQKLEAGSMMRDAPAPPVHS